MIAAIRATPMIRNAAGTMIANPHATAPVAASATDGRPWGTNDVTIGVARHSQAISNPTTTRRTRGEGGAGDGEAVGPGELRAAGKDLHGGIVGVARGERE